MPRRTGLTDREMEVLLLLAGGLRVQVIASLLGISQNRVREIMKQLRGKLGLPDRAKVDSIVSAGRRYF
jgi:DNA-binding CsgD family transcriptional regulator